MLPRSMCLNAWHETIFWIRCCESRFAVGQDILINICDRFRPVVARGDAHEPKRNAAQ